MKQERRTDPPRPAPRRKARSGPPIRRRVDVRVPASTIVKLVVAVLIVVVAVQLWIAFLLFLVAVLLAVTLDPAVRRLEARGMKRSHGGVVVAAAILALAGASVVVIVPPLTQEIGVLVRDFPATRLRIEHAFPADSPVLTALVSRFLELPDSPEVRAWFDRPLVWGELALQMLSGAVVVLMLSMYLLVDGTRTYAWLLSYVPRRHRDRMAETVEGVSEVARSYVRGQVSTSVVCGTYTFGVLTIFGVPAAVPLALAAAILDVIPILGAVAMTVPATLLALNVSPMTALGVLAAYIAYQLIENYIIVPRVYGRTLRLSTLSVMLALLAGGLLQGVLGAILALPLAAAYPIIERIWLGKYLGTHVVTDHAALAESAGTGNAVAVETTVILGETHDDEPAAAPPPDDAAPAPHPALVGEGRTVHPTQTPSAPPRDGSHPSTEVASEKTPSRR